VLPIESTYLVIPVLSCSLLNRPHHSHPLDQPPQDLFHIILPSLTSSSKRSPHQNSISNPSRRRWHFTIIQKICRTVYTHKSWCLLQECMMYGCHIVMASKFCMMVPNIYRCTEWHFLHITTLSPRILRWIIDFW
jgi:hypothetical protein